MLLAECLLFVNVRLRGTSRGLQVGRDAMGHALSATKVENLCICLKLCLYLLQMRKQADVELELPTCTRLLHKYIPFINSCCNSIWCDAADKK